MRLWPDALVLALGVFRVTRLIGWDDFPPVARFRDRTLRTTVDRSLTQRNATATVRHGRPTLAQFVHCPYCLGFWLGLAALAAWWVAPTVTLIALAPFALNAAVGITARMLDP